MHASGNAPNSDRVAALVICAAVAFHFGVSPRALSYDRRPHTYCHADDAMAVAVWLVRTTTELFIHEIAVLFGAPQPWAKWIESIALDTARRQREDPLLWRSLFEIEALLAGIDPSDTAAMLRFAQMEPIAA